MPIYDAQAGNRDAFEKSKYDVEGKGEKEGSPKDLARDKKQKRAFNFAKMKAGRGV